jgi:hypothetical protein
METDLIRIVAKETRADPVEGAGPVESVSHRAGISADDFARNPLDAFSHLRSSPARESHQQDASRIGTIDDQMGDPMGEGVRLELPTGVIQACSRSPARRAQPPGVVPD